MEMPKPSDAHRKLARLAGNWVGEERLFPSPWDPKGGPAIGRVYNRLALDGFAVIQDYEQERNGAVNFRAHGIFYWDAAQQQYSLFWLDSMGMPPSTFYGTFENAILTLTNNQPQGHTRAVWDFSQKDRYNFKMEVSQDGENWLPFTEGSYTLLR